MIYNCKWCHREIKNLRTDGDEVCNDLICQECLEADFEERRKERKEKPNGKNGL